MSKYIIVAHCKNLILYNIMEYAKLMRMKF